jgi:hypothetical protein
MKNMKVFYGFRLFWVFTNTVTRDMETNNCFSLRPFLHGLIEELRVN